MNDHDLDHAESLDSYLSLTALVAEGRQADALTFASSLEHAEQIDMWKAGVALTLTFAATLHAENGTGSLPDWLRSMASQARGDAQ